MFPRLIFIKLLCVNVAIIKKYLSLKSHTSRKPQAEKEIWLSSSTLDPRPNGPKPGINYNQVQLEY